MRYLAILCLFLLLFSCGISDPDTAAERDIRDLIYELGRDFNWNNIDGIMGKMHPEYRHKGMYQMQLRQLWLDRLAQYSLMETSISRVEINGDYAIVFLQATFSSPSGSLTFIEPEDNGDYSYFYYDRGKWWIYGDQGWISK